MHAELFHAIDTSQTLMYAIDSAHQVLHHSCHFSEEYCVISTELDIRPRPIIGQNFPKQIVAY